MSEIERRRGWQDAPEVEAKITILDNKDRLIERARREAAEGVALAGPKIIRRLLERLDDDDPQVSLRAADILLSRLLPKVAAVHAAEEQDVIDSADVASLRESIVAQIKGRTNGR